MCNGLRNGFSTGISPLPTETLECKNNLSASRNPDIVSRLLQAELEKGYVIGPFDKSPFTVYRVNPLGLAEHKYSGKQRLIVDLSAPHSDNDSSLNDLIVKEDYSLHYVTIDDAVDQIRLLGANALLCKFDIADAFKQVPIHPSMWPFHGIKWRDQYYFFKRLVFGSRSSPKIFDLLAQSVCWIATNNFNVTCIFHLLDDFLTLDSAYADGFQTMNTMLHIFNILNIPLAVHKTKGPTTCLEYLGITLDTAKFETILPENKIVRITSIISSFIDKKRCTKRELLSLLGHLNFAARVIIPGRSFISYLLSLAASARKLHHRISLSASCTLELKMWHVFLQSWNGVNIFMCDKNTLASDISLYTDASSSCGFGGIYGKRWFSDHWPSDIVLLDPRLKCLALLELYPIVVASLLWGHQWSGQRIVFMCDNIATVQVINKGRSKSAPLMQLMRRLTLCAMMNNFVVTAKHIPGKFNAIADALSRFQFQTFRQLVPDAELEPETLPAFSETILF